MHEQEMRDPAPEKALLGYTSSNADRFAIFKHHDIVHHVGGLTAGMQGMVYFDTCQNNITIFSTTRKLKTTPGRKAVLNLQGTYYDKICP